MTVQVFPLIVYLASSAYLVSWVIHLLQEIHHWIKRNAHPSKMNSMLKTRNMKGEKDGNYIYMIGILVGVMASLLLKHVFVSEWLLAAFVVVAVLSDEMRIFPNETLLLEVMIFFDRLVAHNESHLDLFDILPDFILELPSGRVRKSVLEAILRWRSGENFENSLDAMCKIDPLLDEFVLTLRHTGWENGSGLNIILNHLSDRAGRRWDRISRNLLVKDKIRIFIQFSRAACITASWVILISSSSALSRVMPDRIVIVLAVLALCGLGFLCIFFLSKQWPRRFLAVSVFIITLAAFVYSLTVPIPAWIQVKAISHQSDNLSETGTITSQISTHYLGLPAFIQLESLTKPNIAEPSIARSTPMPTAINTTLHKPPLLNSAPTFDMDFSLCCLLTPQPR